MRKLYAYSDADGFVRFNKVGGKNKCIFNRRTGEYDYPEKEYSIPDPRVMWLAVAGAYALAILSMVLK